MNLRASKEITSEECKGFEYSFAVGYREFEEMRAGGRDRGRKSSAQVTVQINPRAPSPTHRFPAHRFFVGRRPSSRLRRAHNQKKQRQTNQNGNHTVNQKSFEHVQSFCFQIRFMTW